MASLWVLHQVINENIPTRENYYHSLILSRNHPREILLHLSSQKSCRTSNYPLLILPSCEHIFGSTFYDSKAYRADVLYIPDLWSMNCLWRKTLSCNSVITHTHDHCISGWCGANGGIKPRNAELPARFHRMPGIAGILWHCVQWSTMIYPATTFMTILLGHLLPPTHVVNLYIVVVQCTVHAKSVMNYAGVMCNVPYLSTPHFQNVCIWNTVRKRVFILNYGNWNENKWRVIHILLAIDILETQYRTEWSFY